METWTPIVFTSERGKKSMSKAIRQYIGGPGRDGKQDWPTIFVPDNRATGLRTHKCDRRMTKASLKSGDADSPPNGKRRRYTDRYGAYKL